MKHGKQFENKKQTNQKIHSHYYSEVQSGKIVRSQIKAKLLGNDLLFNSSSGVFSKEHVDKGTQILIENSIIKDGWIVLDLGAGIGVVGIAVAKKYDCQVCMIEINKRAYDLSRENIRLNKLSEKILALQGNLYEPIEKKGVEKSFGKGFEKGVEFDTILLNPPQSAGKDICIKMIEGAINHLKKGGILQIVARHNKGGETLSKHMEQVFGNVSEIAKKSGFRVYISERI
ncbi:MAG: methyltransferase [Nanoarchaeota archaeon]|nr:methyltransferase [Nanoarchaeota archaeon]